jgi:DNA-binding IclR family transcriptional regulator
MLIDILARSNKEEDKPARARAELQRMLGEIKALGYATSTRTRRLLDEVNLSVPVLLRDRVLASLTVRFAASAVPLKSGVERFLPKLRQCAAKISGLFSEQQAEARIKGAPETAA